MRILFIYYIFRKCPDLDASGIWDSDKTGFSPNASKEKEQSRFTD